jgi:polyisoprenoid-binding protein YceI
MRRLTTITLLLVLGTVFTFAQSSYEITSSQMAIAGTSNLHDWETNVTKVEATGDITLDGTTLKSIKSLTVEIPVGGLKSAKGSMMDKKTWSALKKDSYPNITYTLTKVNSLTKSGDSYDIKTTGNLSLAGETRPIEMTVKGKVLANGNLQFEGSKKLKMTDFKIDPPTALMGTMKTGDEITISFNVKLAKDAKVN